MITIMFFFFVFFFSRFLSLTALQDLFIYFMQMKLELRDLREKHEQILVYSYTCV